MFFGLADLWWLGIKFWSSALIVSSLLGVWESLTDGKWCAAVIFYLLFFYPLFLGKTPVAARAQDGSEYWGYVEGRPKAHIFWWLYKSPYRVENPSKPWPIILWLQGGPGASSVGVGSFELIGSLDTALKLRKLTWLQKADLLFVDNPVGTGFSFVENQNLFVKSSEEAAKDLTTLLEKLFNRDERLQQSPLFIVGESYGGKFAVTVGLFVIKAIEAGKLKAKLGGVAIGSAFISPEDYVLSWGPLLKSVSRVDDNGLQRINSLAQKIQQQIKQRQYINAKYSWNSLLLEVNKSSNDVSIYNYMFDSRLDNVMAIDLGSLMNGKIKKKLNILEKVKWGGQSSSVYTNMEGDFMKPWISEVDELLAKRVNVTVYNGQVDLACSAIGAEAWIKKLKWEGLHNFLSMDRTPLYCGHGGTKAFTRSYKNLHFCWILGAGYFVPFGQPCIALKLAGVITQSAAISM